MPRKPSGCGAVSAPYFSDLIMEKTLAITFDFSLINSLFYGSFCTMLDWYGLPYSLIWFIFEVYLANKQINKIMIRRNNNQHGMNDKQKISP